MKYSRNKENLQARSHTHVLTSKDEGPQKRWRSGGYRAPGSLSGRSSNGARAVHGVGMTSKQRSQKAND